MIFFLFWGGKDTKCSQACWKSSCTAHDLPLLKHHICFFFFFFFFFFIENITYKYKIKHANLRDKYIQGKLQDNV